MVCISTFSTWRPVTPADASTLMTNVGCVTTACTIKAEFVCIPQSTATCTLVGMRLLRNMVTSPGSMK
jgi:hypothetical protein